MPENWVGWAALVFLWTWVVVGIKFIIALSLVNREMRAKMAQKNNDRVASDEGDDGEGEEWKRSIYRRDDDD